MQQPFDDFLRRIPDGAFWMTGAMMRELVYLLDRDRVRPGQNLTEIPTLRGRFFNAQAGGGTASPNLCWQLYSTPYTGSGTAPAGWALNVSIRSGQVNDGSGGRFPARQNIVIPVPPNTTGYCIWVEALDNSDGLIQTFDYNHGQTTPGQTTITSDAAGSVPPKAFKLIAVIDSTATAADVAGAYYCVTLGEELTLVPYLSNVSANIERRLVWQPPGSTLANVT